MTTCKDCNKSKCDMYHGGYDMVCLRCCARLVVSARGVGKAQQEAMLESIARAKNSPSRDEVLDYMQGHFPACNSKN